MTVSSCTLAPALTRRGSCVEMTPVLTAIAKTNKERNTMSQGSRVSVVKLPPEVVNKIASDLGLKDASRVPQHLVVSGVPETALKSGGVSHSKTSVIASHVVA